VCMCMYVCACAYTRLARLIPRLPVGRPFCLVCASFWPGVCVFVCMCVHTFGTPGVCLLAGRNLSVCVCVCVRLGVGVCVYTFGTASACLPAGRHVCVCR